MDTRIASSSAILVLVGIALVMYSNMFSSSLLRSSMKVSKSFITARVSDFQIVNYDMLMTHAKTVLQQQIYLLTAISDEDYVKKCPNYYNASVASHIRHSLDHFNAICYQPSQTVSSSIDELVVNYDQRKRDTAVEKDKTVAIQKANELLELLPKLEIERVVSITFVGSDKTFDTYTMNSTVGRELSFVAHHAIHHLSMMKLMMTSMNYELKDNNIGIAPSTISIDHSDVKNS